MTQLLLKNRQRTRPVDLRLLRRMAAHLLQDLLKQAEYGLGIILVDAGEMARLNETFLQHSGSTDVITFDYGDEALSPCASPGGPFRPSGPRRLCGEIYISVDDAVSQARQFGTKWQNEVTRYLVHGTLHLLGYDDLTAADRRRMKGREGRLLRELAESFPLSKLQRKSTLPK